MKASRPSAVLFALIALAGLARSQESTPASDLLLAGGTVIDGTGAPGRPLDVLIRDGRIAALLPPGTAAGAVETLDVTGLAVAPGFIDVHAHAEDGLLSRPAAENFIRMGVTTLVNGNCGGSFVDVGRHFTELETKGIAPNAAMLVGHGSVRSAVLKQANRAPTEAELAAMRDLVRQAMEDGAAGLSTGLIYVPGCYAATEEIIALAREAARHGGLYASHIRSEEAGILDAIEEALRIGREAGCRVQISHFKVSSRALWGRSKDTLALVEKARAAGQEVTLDQYAYTASSTSLDVLFPESAREGGAAAFAARLSDPAERGKILAAAAAHVRSMDFQDLAYAQIGSCPADSGLNGRTIKAVADAAAGRQTTLEEQIGTAMDLIVRSGGRRIQMVYHKMCEEDVERIMASPLVMIAADSGIHAPGPTVPHPRGYGNNARVLGRYCRERKVFPLEEAVRRMTSLPADVFGFRDRGRVASGCIADLVVFDPAKVRDTATFDRPHSYAEGIPHVFVSGKAVVRDGRTTDARPGKVLRGPGFRKDR